MVYSLATTVPLSYLEGQARVELVEVMAHPQVVEMEWTLEVQGLREYWMVLL